ncbi:LysR family transcriptional regulator [Paraferrimonas sedimenticola]|uniref:LysR family transcriptional regulator n=1 Tax=Paraferrimonas sedimenticola TaxID=375674 RepID=A0AA37RW40_9GAMM|nr:LysR family transcriptional regulator [Paraferrimonas sedimenticola]
MGKHQATISGNIARLEDELAVILFDRVGKYPQLSEAGLALYDSAKLVVESSERFNRNALNLSSNIPVTLNLGFDEALPAGAFNNFLRCVRRKYPHLKLHLIRANNARLLKLVEKGELSLAVTMTLEGTSQAYEFKALGFAQIRLLCSDQHPFASKRTVSNDDLLHATQVMHKWSEINPLKELSRMSSDVWECQTHEMVLEAIRANIGWGFSSDIIGTAIPEGTIEFKAEFAGTDFAAQYDCIWPKSHPITEVESYIINKLSDLFSLGQAAFN